MKTKPMSRRNISRLSAQVDSGNEVGRKLDELLHHLTLPVTRVYMNETTNSQTC
jgi:hypothetical protein